MPIQPIPNNADQKSNNKSVWWHQTIVKRAVSFCEHELDHVEAAAPFLRETLPDDTIAVFHRSEILTGSLLGKGGFSIVHEVTGFELKPEVSSKLTPQQQQKRLDCAATCRTTDGSYRYALKHLQPQLLQRKPKEFHCAAADLAVEAAYLSRLDHPHILKARGLPVDGIEALSDGNHDSYFILSDRLGDTLDKRIQTWERESDTNSLMDDRDDGSADTTSMEQKAAHAVQLADALDYLHQHRIVFRDLKPHNIGFTATGDQLQLFDFGLCRELPEDADSFNEKVYEMSGVGTRRYMATEIVTHRKYNCKADVYSFSMILWEMLSLTKPYESYGFNEHTDYVCCGGERPKLDEQWPLTLRNLLQHSWTASVSDRLTMKQVAGLLRTMIAASPSQTNSSRDLLEAPDSPVSSAALLLDISFLSKDKANRRRSTSMQVGFPLNKDRRISVSALSLPTISATGWELDDDSSLNRSLLLSDLTPIKKDGQHGHIFSENKSSYDSIPDLMITSSSSFDGIGMEVTLVEPRRSVTI